MISAPQRGEPAVSRRTRFSQLLPLIVLSVGLLIVAAIVLAEKPLAPGHLKDYFKTVYEPARVGDTGPVTYSAPSPFDQDYAHRPWLASVALMFLYYGSTIAIGSRLVQAIRGDDVWPVPVNLVAGFLPGYLMTLAPLQLLFAALPLQTACWTTLAVTPVIAIILHRQGLMTAARDARHRTLRPGRALGAVGVVLGLFVLAALHRLQQGVFFLTQDSISYFVDMGGKQLAGLGGEYLIHWNAQTDEWLFNAPLTFSSGRIGDLWFPYYVTQSLSVVAFLCLVYGIVHRVARRRKVLAAVIAVAVVFGMTSAIYPWLYVTFIGGGQPVLGLAHPGRLIGIAAPWAALLVLGASRRAGWASIGLATLGFGFVTTNILVLVVGAVVAGVLWRSTGGWAGVLGARPIRAALHVMLPLALVLPVVAFSYTTRMPASPTVPILLLAISGTLSLTGAVVIAAGTERARTLPPGRALSWLAAWAVTLCVGVVFSDNLSRTGIGTHVRSFLATVLPGFDGQIARRVDSPDGPLSGLSFPHFSQAACDSNVSCGGVPYFLVAYGVLYTIVLAVWAGWGRVRSGAVEVNQRRVTLLIGVGLLPLFLIIVFFTGADTIPAGVLTRLLEWPYYTLLVVAVLGFCESRHREVVVVGVGFFAIWTLGPLIGVRWYEEMVRNAVWYLDRLF